MNFLVVGGASFNATMIISNILSTYDECHVISIDNYTSGTFDNHIIDTRVEYIVSDTWNIHFIKKLEYFMPKYIIYSFYKESDSMFECLRANVHGFHYVLDYCMKKNATLLFGFPSISTQNEPIIKSNLDILKEYCKNGLTCVICKKSDITNKVKTKI